MNDDHSNVRVVILDDDEQYLRMLNTICLDEGYDTFAMSDAFEFLRGTYGENDLILLDLSLPGMDGIEVLRKLSEQKSPARLIFVSGQDRGVLRAAEDLAIARQLNYVTSLAKPVKVSELRKVLSKELNSNVTPLSDKVRKVWSPTEKELEEAIFNNEIKAFYQPQMSLSDSTLYGVEALARWEHPERGLIPPYKFIPLAEESGLIVPMTDRLVRSCIADMGRLSKNGYSNLNLSVNISASHIQNYALPEVLLNLVSESQIEPEKLTLEITESGLMTELVTSLDIIARMRLKGFNLSIDDFGTGYSSLYQLHKMPFNELKIDMAFVKNMLSDPDSLSIVETCIMLAKKLGMLTVAEGIEDAGTYNALKQLGCDYAQGYFVAKPMPVENLIEWYESWLASSKNQLKQGSKRYA